MARVRARKGRLQRDRRVLLDGLGFDWGRKNQESSGVVKRRGSEGGRAKRGTWYGEGTGKWGGEGEERALGSRV